MVEEGLLLWQNPPLDQMFTAAYWSIAATLTTHAFIWILSFWLSFFWLNCLLLVIRWAIKGPWASSLFWLILREDTRAPSLLSLFHKFLQTYMYILIIGPVSLYKGQFVWGEGNSRSWELESTREMQSLRPPMPSLVPHYVTEVCSLFSTELTLFILCWSPFSILVKLMI